MRELRSWNRLVFRDSRLKAYLTVLDCCQPMAEEPVEQPPPEHPAASSVSAVTIKIPPFWPADPAIWFAQVEAQFACRGVVQQRTRFDHIIAALAPDVAAEVRDLILHPPLDNPYDHLKQALIKRTEASEQRRLQQLLTAEELGDRKPSQLLRRMQQLLGDSGPAPESAFVRELFLQRLPSTARMILASSASTLSLAQLAEMADGIVEVANPPTVAPVAATSTSLDEVRQLTDTLSRLVAALDSPYPRSRDSSPTARQSRASRQSSRPPSHPSSRSSSPSPYCWYHSKFGTRAKKCRQPCTFPGNAPASH